MDIFKEVEVGYFLDIISDFYSADKFVLFGGVYDDAREDVAGVREEVGLGFGEKEEFGFEELELFGGLGFEEVEFELELRGGGRGGRGTRTVFALVSFTFNHNVKESNLIHRNTKHQKLITIEPLSNTIYLKIIIIPHPTLSTFLITSLKYSNLEIEYNIFQISCLSSPPMIISDLTNLPKHSSLLDLRKLQRPKC